MMRSDQARNVRTTKLRGTDKVETDVFGVLEIISFVGGVAAGLITNALWDMRSAIRRRLTRLVEGRVQRERFEPSSIGLYPINRWSVGRPVERHQVRMTVQRERPRQAWLDTEEWQRLAREFSRSASGEIAYLVGFSIDHRESRDGETFTYSVAPCDFSEHLATAKYLEDHPETVQEIRSALEAGHIAELARTAPPGLIKVNVAILSSSNRFLAIQRSGAVHSKRGLWTVGPNETMRLARGAVPGSRPEDIFELGERCLREEIGFEPSDYERLTISWMGYEASSVSVKVFAQAYTSLPEARIDESLDAAHGVFEIQRSAWIPFTRRVLADITENWRSGDSEGRVWSSSAPFALHELRRMRAMLRGVS